MRVFGIGADVLLCSLSEHHLHHIKAVLSMSFKYLAPITIVNGKRSIAKVERARNE
jgi:hypothetical protein